MKKIISLVLALSMILSCVVVLSGMSFAFKVPEGGDSYDAKTKTRTIHKIEKVYEISVVPFPAYPQTSVEARSAISGQAEAEKRRREAIIKANKILMKNV